MTHDDNHTREARFCMLTGKKQRIEDLVNFPCDYDFKIMGKTNLLNMDTLLQRVESLLGRPVSRDLITQRSSSGGKYTSYTVRVFLEEPTQLTAIYNLLQSEPDVIYYL